MRDSEHGQETEVTRAERVKRALELRARGLSYQGIVDTGLYRSKGGAHGAIKRALAAMVREPAKEVRQLELGRLDSMAAGLWTRATAGNIQAIDCVLRLMSRRAALLGLDSPSRVEVTRLLQSEQWMRLKGAIIGALADEPRAREKVLAALVAAGDDNE